MIRGAAAAILVVIAVRVDALDCSALRQRHAALLGKPFSIERDLTLHMDGKVRARQAARLSWNGTALDEKILSTEPENATVDIHGDPVVSMKFTCEGWQEADGGELAFRSPDGATIVFRVDAGGELLPIRWEETQTVRVLFSRHRLVATASFSNFSRP